MWTVANSKLGVTQCASNRPRTQFSQRPFVSFLRKGPSASSRARDQARYLKDTTAQATSQRSFSLPIGPLPICCSRSLRRCCRAGLLFHTTAGQLKLRATMPDRMRIHSDPRNPHTTIHLRVAVTDGLRNCVDRREALRKAELTMTESSTSQYGVKSRMNDFLNCLSKNGQKADWSEILKILRIAPFRNRDYGWGFEKPWEGRLTNSQVEITGQNVWLQLVRAAKDFDVDTIRARCFPYSQIAESHSDFSRGQQVPLVICLKDRKSQSCTNVWILFRIIQMIIRFE